MDGALSQYFVQIAGWGGVLVVLIAVGVWVTLRFRDSTAEDTLPPSEALTNFQEMRQNGDISDAEFRTIKAVVGAKLRRKINDVDSKG